MASHTHFAPSLDDFEEPLGKVDEDYFNYTVQLVSENIVELLKAPTAPSTIKFTCAQHDLTINRRRRVPNIGKNPRSGDSVPK